MAETIYEKSGVSIDDLPRTLRIGAAVGGVQISLDPASCVHLARRIEEHRTVVLTHTVDRAPDRIVWACALACLAVHVYKLLLVPAAWLFVLIEALIRG